jgi:hypothetical protein
MDKKELKMNYLKLSSYLAVAVAFFAFGFYLGNKNKPTVINGPAVISTPGNTVVVTQPGKPPTQVYQPDPNSTVISTDSHGNVTIKVKQVGLGFDPGVGVAYSDRLRLTLDARVAFYKRWGLNPGLAFRLGGSTDLTEIVKPYLAVSYALPFKLASNTSAFVGMGLDKGVIGGFRVRF